MKTNPVYLLQDLIEKSEQLTSKIRSVENSTQFQKLFSNAFYSGPSWQEETFELENLVRDIKKEIE